MTGGTMPRDGVDPAAAGREGRPRPAADPRGCGRCTATFRPWFGPPSWRSRSGRSTSERCGAGRRASTTFCCRRLYPGDGAGVHRPAGAVGIQAGRRSAALLDAITKAPIGGHSATRMARPPSDRQPAGDPLVAGKPGQPGFRERLLQKARQSDSCRTAGRWAPISRTGPCCSASCC